MPDANHQLARCEETFELSLEQEAQCALYAGHLEAHETEPLPPVREDKSDGVHQVTWLTDEAGEPTEVKEVRLDAPEVEEEQESADA